jgi:hypothetical protein
VGEGRAWLQRKLRASGQTHGADAAAAGGFSQQNGSRSRL